MPVPESYYFTFVHQALLNNSDLNFSVNSGVQHPVARVSIRFINVTTVRNYFLFFTCFI
jgi:hypothetical protein